MVVPAEDDPDANQRIAGAARTAGRLCLATPPSPAHRAESPGAAGTGHVTLVGGGPGDPGLLTVAGLDAISRADVIISDRLAPLAALSHAPAGARVIDVAKIPRGEYTPQEQINDLLVEHARAGRRVVRLKGGDNFVFGRGGEELQACAAAGIPVTVIPGVSSAIAAPALAGIPLTHRSLTQGVTVVSAHLPPGHEGSTLDWAALARANTTLVIMMGVATLPDVSAELIAQGMDPATPAATIADAGLPSQHSVRATLATIAAATRDAGIAPPAVTVIGAVAGFEASPSAT
jgi:uroporphyrin-III C-methyltransferase